MKSNGKHYPRHTRRGKRQHRQQLGKRRAGKAHRRQKAALRYTNRTATQYGFFYPVAMFLLKVLGLKTLFESHISVTHKGRDFTCADFCITLVVLPILGIERISHIDDTLKAESTVAQMLGMSRFCCQKTLHGFLNRCSGWQVRQLETLNYKLLVRHTNLLEEPSDPRQLRIVDVDAQTRSTEGKKRQKAKPGNNTKAKGRDCYLWSVAAFCGFLLAEILDSGNIHCKHHLKVLLSKVESVVSSIGLLRLDGGYLLGLEDLKYLQGLSYPFITKVKASLCVVRQAVEASCPGDWIRVNRTTQLLDCGWVYLFEGASEPIHLIVVKARRRIRKVKNNRIYYQTKTLYWGIVTNLKGDQIFFQGKYRPLTALWIFRIYQKRWTIENSFREMNQSFNSGKLPSQLFRANQCYLWGITIAYNAMLLFKQRILPAPARGWMLKTIQRRLLCVSASVCVEEGVFVMDFHPDFPYKQIHRIAVGRINRLLEESPPQCSSQVDESQPVMRIAV